MSKTMTRQKPKRKKPPEAEVKPRAFVPRPCSECQSVRKPNTNYSRVYSVHGKIRYCKCSFCGNTWTQTISADQIAMPIANADTKTIGLPLDLSDDKGHGDSGIPTGTNRLSD